MSKIKIVRVVQSGDAQTQFDNQTCALVQCDGMKLLITPYGSSYYIWNLYPHTESAWKLSEESQDVSAQASLLSVIGAKPSNISINF